MRTIFIFRLRTWHVFLFELFYFFCFEENNHKQNLTYNNNSSSSSNNTVVHFINISIFNLIRVRAIGRLFIQPADSGVPHYVIHSFGRKKISIKYNRVENINIVSIVPRGVRDFFVAPQLRSCGHTLSFLGDGNNNKYDVDVAVFV